MSQADAYIYATAVKTKHAHDRYLAALKAIVEAGCTVNVPSVALVAIAQDALQNNT